MTTSTPPDVEETSAAPAAADTVPALAGRRPQLTAGGLLALLVLIAVAVVALRRRSG